LIAPVGTAVGALLDLSPGRAMRTEKRLIDLPNGDRGRQLLCNIIGLRPFFWRHFYQA
jgi:hypothetical protein